MKVLRLILGDQLNAHHSWFSTVDEQVLYVMMELRSETDYVKHHVQKVVGFFAAMRRFKDRLKAMGHRVEYLKINDPKNKQSFKDNLLTIIEEHGIEKLEYLLPDEYRLDQELNNLHSVLGISVTEKDTEHFLTKRNDLKDFFKGKKTFLMESFYRQMRKDHNVLMEGGQPLGERWNFDQENRKKLPKGTPVPPPKLFSNDVEEILNQVKESGAKTFGEIDPKNFLWPLDEDQSELLLVFFVKELLPQFGAYQDAMQKPYWSMFHSRLSFAMNTKILSPRRVIDRSIEEWEARPGEIPLSGLEGFIRQILGWREYMRGIYWAKMPEYSDLNFFNHKAKLPSWFWTGETKMACLSDAIGQSLNFAYAHHIQRLMVTGNFALLAGVDPDEVDRWYLGIYIDAIEWVEITNTRGMSQYADGGLVGSKPYVSSASYIHKMSGYCSSCFYDHKLKTGDRACPFNSLYWNFYDRNRGHLERNPRIGMAYRTWDKMDADKRSSYLEQAQYYLENIEEL